MNMNEIYWFNSDAKYHKGALGGYLQDEHGVIYGLTCRHVTHAATDGTLYYSCGGETFTRFGETMKRNDECKIYTDIDVFKINYDKRNFCNMHFIDYNGQQCQAINMNYDDKTTSLFDKDVFMWRIKYDKKGKEIKERVDGCIISNGLYKSLGEECPHILLFTSNKTEEGDSGRALLMESSNQLYIVGLVIGGTKLIHNTTYYMCIEINHGLRLLNGTYQRSFHFPMLELASKYSNFNALLSGIYIFVKSPEDIAKIDFDLGKHVIMLIDCLELKPESNTTEILSLKDRLSLEVSERRSTLLNETSGSVEEKCILHCMLGCESLYSEQHEISQNHFKDAARLLKRTCCTHFLLSQLLTYTTWLLLKTRQCEDLKTLLEEGEKYLLKMKENNICSSKYLGYYYFDYARYYNANGQYADALKMAKQSLTFFLSDESVRGKITSSKCFALAMIAKMNLLCGDNFETRHLSVLDLKEAEECIKDIEEMGVLPAVEKTSYLLVKSDLHYRRGETKIALETAKACSQLAKEKRLVQESREAYERVRALSNK